MEYPIQHKHLQKRELGSQMAKVWENLSHCPERRWMGWFGGLLNSVHPRPRSQQSQTRSTLLGLSAVREAKACSGREQKRACFQNRA